MASFYLLSIAVTSLIMNILRYRWFLLSVLLPFFGTLRAEDTLRLLPVEVYGQRLDAFAASAFTFQLGKTILDRSATGSLTDMLSAYSNLTIKQYGYGGISSVSMRGGYANQTAVLWNGFNLNDPLNGSVNLNLFPAFFIDKLSIHKGGETALFGGGSMSGSVNITTNATFNRGLTGELLLSGGSFGACKQGLALAFSSPTFSTRVKLFHSRAENDFPFTNTALAGSPIQRQQNAAMEAGALLLSNAWQTSPAAMLTFDLWLNDQYNEVPVNMTAVQNSGENMRNKNGRLAASYTHYRRGRSFKLRTALLLNSLQYNNPAYALSYLHRSVSSISEAQYRFKPATSTLLESGLSLQYVQGISESLAGTPDEVRSAAFVSLRQNMGTHFLLKANVRQELQRHYVIPLTWSFSLSYHPQERFGFYTSIAKTYRVPTFNDLYWSDAWSRGNPGLRPEKGFDEELGMQWHSKNQRIETSAAAFFGQMNDLIQWVPDKNVWSPQNVEKVLIYGADLLFKADVLRRKTHSLALRASYTFTRSLLAATPYAVDWGLDGNQLIYTPLHKASALASFRFRRYTATVSQAWTSRLYTSASNTEWLPPAFPMELSLSADVSTKKISCLLLFKIINVLNGSYYMMPNYPMPGTHYELSLRLNFHHHNKD